MTFKAEIIGLAARKGLQHVIRVRRLMWIMACEAIVLSRRVQRTLADNGLPVFMTLQAERNDRGGFQFDAGDVVGNPNLMAGKTAYSDGCMNRFPFGLIFVTLQAFGSGFILFKRGGMLTGLKGHYPKDRP